MKVYIDNFDYFTDLITDDTTFKISEDNLVDINGVQSPRSFLPHMFVKNDKLIPRDIVKKTLKEQYFTIAQEHTIVENPDECDVWYVIVSSINFFYQIDKYRIDKKILNNLQLQKCKLLIDIPDDGWFASKCNNSLECLQDWLKDNNILEESVYVKNMNLISNERDTKINMITSTIHSESYLDNVPTEVCKFDKIDKFFLNYNRTISNHKLYLAYSLFQTIGAKMITHSLFSFSDKYIHGETETNGVNYNIESLITFLNSIPYTIDNTDIDDQGRIGQLIEHNHYERTFVSLVSESTSEDGVVYLSEKTFKPIAMGHPFIIVGSKGSLKKLKEIGYKTFERWFDESYDTMESYSDRIDCIMQILHEYKAKKNEQLIIIRKEMSKVIQHNFELFNKRRKNKGNENSFSNRL